MGVETDGITVTNSENQDILHFGTATKQTIDNGGDNHSTIYYAENQSVSNGSNVTVTTPTYNAYATYFADITGYIYSTERTTRVYLKPTNSSMDIFYGEIVDCDLDGGLYDQFFVILEKVSDTSYTYRCVESGQENSFLDLMKKATTYRSNSGHTLTNFGILT